MAFSPPTRSTPSLKNPRNPEKMAPEAGADDGETNQHTVFIDTSLDTHLATIVSDTDTVSDLKQKITVEHKQCFPAIGDIRIHCLKVKRRGNFYHLSESLLVRSAFRTSRKNWFLFVDASRLEQDGEMEHLVNCNAGDKLALPWLRDNRSIDKLDSHAGGHANPSLVHGSPSIHHKTVPFVNQSVPTIHQSTSGDSCKDVSKNMVEDRSCDDNHWRSSKPDSGKFDPKVQEKPNLVDVKTKKRIRDVHNERSFEDALESRLSVKKKRKTERVEGSVKASEGDGALIADTDKAKHNALATSQVNFAEDTSKVKDVNLDGVLTKTLDDKHIRTTSVSRKKKSRINKDKGNSDCDQLAPVVPFSGVDVQEEMLPRKITEASKTTPDVSMVFEENIQQETPFGISQKEKSDELAEKASIGNEVSSSLMRTNDGEHHDPEVTAPANLKGAKSSTKHNAVEDLCNVNQDAIGSSQQELGSTGQEFAGNEVDKQEEDRALSLNQGPEVKLPGSTTGSKRKKTKKTAAKSKDKSLVKHADNLVNDIPSTVQVPAFDDNIIEEHKNDKDISSFSERNEVSEKKPVDDSFVYASEEKADDLIVKEVEVSRPTESNRSQVHPETAEENSREELKDTVANKRKKRHVERCSLRDGSVLKKGNDAAMDTEVEERKESLETTSIDALHVDRGRNDDNPMVNEVETSKPIGTDENVDNKLKGENKQMDGTKRKKKKTKNSAARNEDESIGKQVNADVCGTSPTVPDTGLDGQSHENVKKDTGSLPDAARKEIPKEKLADVSQANETNRDEDGANGKRNKQNSTSQSLANVPDEEQGSGVDRLQLNKLENTQDTQNLDEGLVRKAKKVRKSSAKDRSNRQSAELELEPEKSKGTKHSPLPEETSKNVVSSEVPKVRMEGRDDDNAKVDISKNGSHEIDFKHYFVLGQERNPVASVDSVKDVTRSEREKKPKNKTKQAEPPVEASPKLQNEEKYDSRIDSTVQAPKPLSKIENTVLLSSKKTSEVCTDGVKEPNFPNNDRLKPPKRTRKTEPPRISKSAPANKRNIEPSNDSSSSSSSESSRRSFRIQVSNKQTLPAVKTSKKSAQVVNNSQGVKSLLNTHGGIFGDSSDESSADDNTSINSGSSTRTPSNKSSSSRESDSSLDSRRNGSSAMKGKASGSKNSINSQSKLKNVSMADLLRSSSRYRKARLTASQQMEDTESQPVDFVPESQPIRKR